jgi:hypothetical protein
MSDSNKTSPAKIRTFAGDLEIERERQGKKPKQEKVVEVAQDSVVTPPEAVILNKIPEKVSPEKIPSFHELHKQVDNIEATSIKPKREPRIKVKKKKSKKIKLNVGFDATVITDTQSKRFKLIPSIIDSIKSWFKEVTASKKKKVHKYTIPETSRRKGVIQKATSKSGSLFTADSETIKERVRQRQQRSFLDESVDQEEPDTSWSPFTESGYGLLKSGNNSGDTTQNIKVGYKKVSIPTPPIPRNPSLEQTESDMNEARWVSAEESFREPTPVVDKIPEAEGVPETKPDDEVIEDTPDQKKEEEFKEVIVPQPEVKSTDTRKVDTNTLSIIILSSIIGLVIIIIVARIIFVTVTERTNTDFVQVSPPESILADSNIKAIVLTTENLDDLAKLISESRIGTNELTEIVITTESGEEVSPSYVFELLGFEASAALKQSLTSIRFVISDSMQEESILLSFNNETMVRGSLLLWETSILNDMRPLYSLPESSNLSFIDNSIEKHDVRIIKQNKEVVLLYSIVSDNTAIISKNISDFTEVLESSFAD